MIARKNLFFLGGLLFLWGIVSNPFQVWALSDQEILDRMEKLTQTIQNQQKEIEALKQQLQQKMDISAAPRKEDIKAAVKEEVKDQVKDSLPEWTKRLWLSGDLRLRYEGLFNRIEYKQVGSAYKQVNTTDRNRFRYRLRFVADGTVSEDLHAIFSIGSSSPLSGTTDNNATVSNYTFSNEFTQKPDYILLAYAKYNPKWLPGLGLFGGKFKPPFIHTDIMFDPDTALEGFYETYKHGKFKPFQPFAGLGQFVVSEQSTKADAMLYLYQAGFEADFGPVKWTLAGSFYDYWGMASSRIGSTTFGGGFGNSLTSAGTLKYDYRLLDFITYLDFRIGKCPLRFFGEYVQNIAKDVKEDTAYNLGFIFNKTVNPGDWELFFKYSMIKADAVVGAFADGDFYFANRQGWKAMFTYRLLKHVDFRTSFFMTDTVTRSKEMPDGDPEQRLQVDFILRW